MTTEYGAINKVLYFSVDGSPVPPRRKVVDIAKCNGCHSTLSLHGENRNQIEQCVLCHNPSENDGVRRVVATNAADKAQPNQSVNFALMIHKIHTGEGLTEADQSYTIVGFGGSHNDFTEVRYPTMTPTGGVGRHGQVLHVPRQQLRSRLPHRQEQRDRSAGQNEPRRGHHFGLHGVPPDTLGAVSRGMLRPIRSSAKAAMFATRRVRTSTSSKNTPASKT